MESPHRKVELIVEIKSLGRALEMAAEHLESLDGCDLRLLAVGGTKIRDGLKDLVRAVSEDEEPF